MTHASCPMLVQARRCYEKLEQALMPLIEAIQELEQDWNPREAAFWQRITTALASIRQAVNACLALFHEPSLQPTPVAACFDAASIVQSCCLYEVAGRLDEAGIRLTSYRNRASFAEKHIRQRQGVLHALRELHRAGQHALGKGRTWLDQIQRPGRPQRTAGEAHRPPTAYLLSQCSGWWSAKNWKRMTDQSQLLLNDSLVSTLLLKRSIITQGPKRCQYEAITRLPHEMGKCLSLPPSSQIMRGYLSLALAVVSSVGYT